jgi:hypothetical protein
LIIIKRAKSIKRQASTITIHLSPKVPPLIPVNDFPELRLFIVPELFNLLLGPLVGAAAGLLKVLGVRGEVQEGADLGIEAQVVLVPALVDAEAPVCVVALVVVLDGAAVVDGEKGEEEISAKGRREEKRSGSKWKTTHL